jgi:LPXTG-motif cell wall-anchored protein
VILTARAPISVVGHQRSVDAMTRAALAKHTGEKMDTTTLLVIVLVVLLLGGGGFFYRRRA